MVDHCRHHHGVVERELPPSGGLTGGGACLPYSLLSSAMQFFFSLPFSISILDAIFSTSFVHALQHEFSIYFDFRARGAARNQQNPFAAVVIMVIECRSN
jgi:hypothetical protein